MQNTLTTVCGLIHRDRPPYHADFNVLIDSAASAVRNLNDFEVMNRKLRVDFSNEGGTDADNEGHGAFSAANGYNQAPPPVAASSSSLPPLPPGKELPPNVTATDAISRTLNTLPPSQLLDILTQMKSLASNDPARATELLQQAPQLSYAVFQALLLMGLVSPDAIRSVVDNSAAAPPVGFPHQANSMYAVAPPPAGATTTPKLAAPPYSAPGQPASYPAAPAPQAPPPGDGTEALMAQVMALPMETINMLPEAERSQILALRAQFMGPGR